jgi:two-component system LytT family response regulator
MNLLIVDDEAPARARLRRMLEGATDVSVHEAGGAAEALSVIAAQHVDAALLDIHMPGVDGLALALELPAHVLCVFCTAYDAYALQAFELNAVDYLLKPVRPERLTEALARLRARMAMPPQRAGLVAALQQLQPVAQHWLVERRGALHKLALAQVQWVASADNYIELHAPPQCDLERRTLASFLAHPAAAGFVRVHRCHAVNAAHIVEIAPLANGEARVTLTCGQQLRVSRNYRAALA